MSKGFLTFAFALWLCVVAHGADTDVVINEILYSADSMNNGGEFIELYNRGAAPVDLGNWVLTDAVDFTFPAGTVIPGGGYLVVARNALSASAFYGVSVLGSYSGQLSNGGDQVVLRDDAIQRVIVDAVFYEDEAPWPLEADGIGSSLEMVDPFLDNQQAANWHVGQLYSPGAPNNPGIPQPIHQVNDIVISEIMYNPRREEERRDNRGPYMEQGDDELGEYVEIVNRGLSTVDLSGWTFSGGIAYTFESDVSIAPGEYLVVCGDPDATRARFGIDVDNVAGPFDAGALADSGERITLRDDQLAVVDTVEFNDRHPWPVAADSYGSSLEVIDIDQDNSHAGNWRASTQVIPPVTSPVTETDWQFTSATGAATSSRLYFYTDGPGEWLLDEITVVRNGTPTIAHYDFEEGSGSTIHNAVNGAAEGTLLTGAFSSDAPTLPDGQTNNFSVNFAGIGLGGAVYIDGREFVFNAGGVSGDATLEWYMKTPSQPHSSVFWTNRDNGTDDFRFNIYYNPSGQVSADFNEGQLNQNIGGTGDTIPFNVWTHVAIVRRSVGGETFDWNWYVDGVQRGGTTRSTNPRPQSVTWSVGGRPGCCPYNGKMDEVRMTARALAPSEFLINSVSAAGGDTVVFTESFEGGDSGWTGAGNQSGSWTTQDSHDGTGAVRLVGTGAGSGSSHSYRYESVPGLVEGEVYTISFWAKWLSGHPTMTSRVSGGGILQTLGFSGLPEPPLAGAVGHGTPGQMNSVAAVGVPPLVEDLHHLIETPTSSQTQTLLATVRSSDPITMVRARVTYDLADVPIYILMLDDGLNGDGLAGDGVYGGRVSPRTSKTIVHYSVEAFDAFGRMTTFPYPGEPSPTYAYYHYNDDVNTQLTRYDLFIESSAVGQLTSDPYREEYVDCSLVIDGVAYPHIETRLRGAGSRTHPKLQWKFRFNRGNLYDGNRTLDTMLNIPFVQNTVFELFRRSGMEGNFESELIRVDREGSFWGTYIVFESPNSTWVRKHDLEDETEVYKARTISGTHNSDLYRNQLITDMDYWLSWNKKTRSLEVPTEIKELIAALNDMPTSELLPWMDRHIDLDQWFQRWALYILMNVDDFAAHNYYLMLPGGPGAKWQQYAYDFDSGFTYNRVGALRALYGDGSNGDLWSWQRGRLYEIVADNPTLTRIYFFKLDDMLTDYYHSGTLFPVIDQMFNEASVDRSLDNSRWGTMRGSTSEIKSVFSSQRSRMLSAMASENLPDVGVGAFPPPGSFDDQVSVSLVGATGWDTVYTLDGSDPRLSDTAIDYLSPVFVDQTTTIRVALLRGAESAGDWSRVSDFDYVINGTLPTEVGPFLRGDCNSDGRVRAIDDALTILFHNFAQLGFPQCLAACDADGDGQVEGVVTDAVYLLIYGFLNGPSPASPFPSCLASLDIDDVINGCAVPQTCP